MEERLTVNDPAARTIDILSTLIGHPTVAVNIIPEQCKFCVDYRYLPGVAPTDGG